RVRAIGVNRGGATLFERLRRLAKRTGGVDHVVHDDAGAAVDLADDVHDFGHIGARTALVDNGQISLELLGQRTGPHHATDVWRHHDQVLVVATPDVAQQDGAGIDVVDGNVEKALDLVGM